MMPPRPCLLQLRTRALPVTAAQETTMTIRSTILAAALALTTIGAAQAESLQPRHSQSITLGTVSGVAYYTAERDGFRVVATLAQGEAGTPVRFEAVLAPGQSVVLSTPRGLGAPSDTVEIGREHNTVFVRKAAAAVTN